MYFRFAASFVMYFTEFEIKKIICEKYQYAIRNQIVIVTKSKKNKKWVSDMGMRWKYFEPGGGTRTGGERRWKLHGNDRAEDNWITVSQMF